MKIINEPNRLLRLCQLIGADGLLPISRSTLYAWIAAGKFPAPIKLGPRVSAWRASDVMAFIDGPDSWAASPQASSVLRNAKTEDR